MKVIHTAAGLPAPRDGVRRAVVMTMGALHEGHLSLVRAARQTASEVLVTIFVNPLQFNDPADLDRYPRTLEADVALLRSEDVDIVYAPSGADVYPHGTPIVSVSAGQINDYFEGAHRPGHFDGVLTVVLKLLNQTRPHVAHFGQKDAQQAIAIRTMVRDLDLPVEVVVGQTVRDADGLALSSRNRFLSSAERSDALVLSRGLAVADATARMGAPVSEVLEAGRAVIAQVPSVELDYLGALDPASAAPVEDDYRGEVVIAVAARVGATRLIDNIVTRLGNIS